MLYGVSYGTKVALTYAARHPDRVAGLVLDSVVPADGPDPFARAAFTAAPRVLRELCADGACKNATRSVTADLRNAVRALRRRPLRGFVTSPSGSRVVVELDLPALWDVLAGRRSQPGAARRAAGRAARDAATRSRADPAPAGARRRPDRDRRRRRVRAGGRTPRGQCSPAP